MRRALFVAAAAALLAVPCRVANGDPASDVLLTQPVFFPFDATLADSDREALQKTVEAANEHGYKIRVALIPFTSDLGTAVSLWKHPQDYSKFLGSELAFVYAQAAADRAALRVRHLQPPQAGRPRSSACWRRCRSERHPPS